MKYSLSNTAPSSLDRVFQYSTFLLNSSFLGANLRSLIYVNVVSSGAIIPPRAPISILILHTVIRPSILIFSKTSPAYSQKYPVPELVPNLEIIYNITSFGRTPFLSFPLTLTLKLFGLVNSKHWLANTWAT